MSGLIKSYQVEWKVGIRKREQGILSVDSPFFIIQNPWYGWAADPFLFEKDGTVYIFAEVWNYFRQRGSIAFCCYQDGKASPWKNVISEWHHMSYPFIWEDEQGIHICAETNEAKKIYTYRAAEFPFRWKKETVILEGDKYADTTLLPENGTMKYLFSYQIQKGTSFLVRGRLQKDMSLDGKLELITNDARIARPGGKFFSENGELYRVAQNCSVSYGESLIFLKLLACGEHYQEEFAFERRLEEIKMQPEETACIGMHTYNRSEHFEVVDFRIRSFHFWDYIFSKLMIFRNFIGRNVLKVVRIFYKKE